MHHAQTRDADGEPDGWETPFAGLRLRRGSSVPITAVQVFGQRCSGTNVLAKLVSANFGAGALTDRHGFKHWFVAEHVCVSPDELVLVIARNAFDWVRSLHRQPWHVHPDTCRLDFARFVRAEWHCIWDDAAGVSPDHPLFGREMLHERDPSSGARFANPLAKRVAKLRNWRAITARAHNVALLDYEVMNRAPGAFLEVLGTFFARPPTGDLEPTASYKGNGFRPFRPSAYPPLSPADEDFVRQALDPGLEAQFGLPA